MIDILEGVSFVHSACLPEVGDQVLAPLAPSISVEGFPPKPGGDLVHLLVLECLPEVVGDVEHDALEEEHEGHPLVVGVHPPVLLIPSLRTNSLMWTINTVDAFVLG